jgi:hypothetical protein
MELPRNGSGDHDTRLDDREPLRAAFDLLGLLSPLDVASLVFAVTTVRSVALDGALALSRLAVA